MLGSDPGLFAPILPARQISNKEREILGNAAHTLVHGAKQEYQGYHWQKSQVDSAPELGLLCHCKGGCNTVFHPLFAAIHFLFLRRGSGMTFALMSI
jgi:hypothetical protein